jgi:hypothetical protein
MKTLDIVDAPRVQAAAVLEHLAALVAVERHAVHARLDYSVLLRAETFDGFSPAQSRLDDVVHDDLARGQRVEDAGGRAGVVGHAAERDAGEFVLEGGPADDDTDGGPDGDEKA